MLRLLLPGGYKWTELRRKLIRWSRGRWVFYNSFQKFVKARPSLLIFRLYIRKTSYRTLKYYQSQTPYITAVVISASTNSFRLQKKSIKFCTLRKMPKFWLKHGLGMELHWKSLTSHEYLGEILTFYLLFI